ncbi:unnamed protein product [Umbelopsis ramanniana]
MAGAGAGVVEVLIMQSANRRDYNEIPNKNSDYNAIIQFSSLRVASLHNQGVWRAFTKVVKDEGFLALYRGTAPVVCIVGPRVS